MDCPRFGKSTPDGSSLRHKGAVVNRPALDDPVTANRDNRTKGAMHLMTYA